MCHSTTMKIIATFAFLVFLVGCTRSSEEGLAGVSDQRAQKPSPETSATPGQATIDHRSQFDLAAAIRLVEHVRNDEDRASAFSELSRSWQGSRYRWTVSFLSAFCPNASGCHVVPFERGGKDKDIVQGWSPQLEISDSQWERLAGACAQRQTPCRVTFAGTLSEFRISTEELTRLTFTDISLLAVTSDAAI